MAEGADSVATELIGRLEQAWNEADGRTFGEPFTADADFVDIRGSTTGAEKRSQPATRQSSTRSIRAAAPATS
jgi:hypothetical protein